MDAEEEEDGRASPVAELGAEQRGGCFLSRRVDVEKKPPSTGAIACGTLALPPDPPPFIDHGPAQRRRGSGSPAMAVAAGSGALGWRGAPPPAARRPPHPGATPSPEDVVTSSPLDPVRRVGEGAHHGSMPWIWCEGGGRGLAVVGRERKRRAAGARRDRSRGRWVGVSGGRGGERT